MKYKDLISGSPAHSIAHEILMSHGYKVAGSDPGSHRYEKDVGYGDFDHTPWYDLKRDLESVGYYRAGKHVAGDIMHHPDEPDTQLNNNQRLGGKLAVYIGPKFTDRLRR